MKRKRLDRDRWGFHFFPYYQTRVETDCFRGLACLIRLLDGEPQYWQMPKAGKVMVAGPGMCWLQLIPDDRRHMITAKYLPDGQVAVWYADIIDGIAYDIDGVAVFIDQYLDVIFTPQGDLMIDDRDELDAAYKSGELSKEQYEAAIREGKRVVREWCRDLPGTKALCDGVLKEMNRRIEAGEKPFKPCPFPGYEQ